MGGRSILREYATVWDIVHRTFDLLALIIGALIAHNMRFGQTFLSEPYREALVLALLIAFVVFRWASLYQSWRAAPLMQELRRVTLAWGMVFVLLTLVAFFVGTGSTYSREWAIYWWTSTWGLLVSGRLAGRVGLRWLRTNGRNFRRVAVIGAGRLASDTIRQLREVPWTGLRVVAVFDDDARGPHVGLFEGVPVCGGLRDVGRYVDEGGIDQVWLCLPLRAEDQMRAILDDLKNSHVDIRFVPDIFGFHLLNHSLTQVGGLPLINLSTTPLEGWNRVFKEIEDRVLAAMILTVISPLMIALAIGVKLSSPGPIIFRQWRHGWDGRRIEVWKFRSMRAHEDHGTVIQATRDDSRITPFGAFLRRTSLDELPQFINVLQGRMSIVGPRPHAVEHNELYKDVIEQYMRRHKVKPGITGWAQINGLRGETETVDKMQKRVEYDLYYIENWSLWFDLKIILMTPLKGFVNKNAY